MKTKTMMVALVTLLLGSLCFWACQEDEFLSGTTIEKDDALSGDAPEAKAGADDLGRVGPNDYIVVFKPEVQNVPGLARQLAARHDGEISFIYEHAIKGFAANLPPQAIEALSRHPLIDWIEADQLYFPVNAQANATWGLDRIDQRGLPLDQTYHYNQTGQGVSVYIIDTGIHYTHQEFGGRAIFGFDASRHGDGSDGDGHGTHVAGTVGGSTYGVAKDVTLVSVRVLGGGGSAARNIIAGVDWVTANRVLPAVANMSLGGRASNALDAAIRASIDSGVTYVVAGGNYSDDACNYSPSRVREALTLGATRNTDEKWDKSNYGECVDLFAPGVSITSAINSSNTATAVYSGTSMAAPHAAGVAALYLELNPEASPSQVFAAVTEATTKGIVTNSFPGNNNLLYSLEWSEGDPPPPLPNEPPVADFSFEITDLKVTFTDKSYDPDGEVVAWAWDFGDGANSDERNPAHTYASAGTYAVILTVTDNEDATDTATQYVTVSSDDNGGEPGELTIEHFGLTNNSNPQWARVLVNWEVSGADLSVVTVSISGPNSDDYTWNVSGNSASGEHEFSFRRGFGEYQVTLTVTDSGGTLIETKQITL